jgi:ERCC4-type nuclease
MLRIDYRESELIELLKSESNQTNIDIKPLIIGDIWIGNEVDEKISEGGLIIERKSIRDFEASFLDGRYREQRGRILSFCQEHKTQPLYILEGPWSSLTGRLTKKAIFKLVNRLILHYQIPVLQTNSIEETSELIQTLLVQWKEDPTSLQRTNELVKVSDGIHIQKKVNSSDPKQFAICCLAQCPGVSVKMAEALLKTFGSLKIIMNTSSKELEQVKIGNRKIGPVVSKRLFELLNHT